MKTKQDWINALQLEAHPEGGYYKRTYETFETITLPDTRTRALSSTILFLLSANNPSHFHRLRSDELWFYHTGHSLTIHLLYPNGDYKAVKLGVNEDEHVQFLVPRGVIFGSSIDSDDPEAFAVVSCVVSPAFHFDDFELFTKDMLKPLYPQQTQIIDKLAYDKLPE